jgi:hypothetical protein
MLQISSLRTPASRLQLNLNYSYPAGAPAFRAWAAALAWAAVLGSRAWAAVLACQAWAVYPGSVASSGSDSLVNRESCDVEFPFANSPYMNCGAWKPERITKKILLRLSGAAYPKYSAISIYRWFRSCLFGVSFALQRKTKAGRPRLISGR